LVPPEPEHFGKRESFECGIGREVAQSWFAADAFGDLATFAGRAPVAPEERGANHVAVRIEKDRRVHLSRDADGVRTFTGTRAQHRTNRRRRCGPPGDRKSVV